MGLLLPQGAAFLVKLSAHQVRVALDLLPSIVLASVEKCSGFGQTWVLDG